MKLLTQTQGPDQRRLFHLPNLIKGMNPICQHQEPKSQRRDKTDERNFTEIKISPELLIAVESDNSSEDKKKQSDGLQKNNSKCLDQVTKSI
jgi:hypothetical protein